MRPILSLAVVIRGQEYVINIGDRAMWEGREVAVTHISPTGYLLVELTDQPTDYIRPDFLTWPWEPP
ncbi:MAG: hypothetical protein ACREEE_05595 [Dongiaceae bacterium]